MGSVGVTTQSTREPFNYGEYSMTHTKIETAHEFTRQTGIQLSAYVAERLTKATLVELCKQVDEQAEQFKKDWGFTPAVEIFDTRSGFMCARGWKGVENLAMGVNVSQANKYAWYINESVAHEFGHLAYHYLMWKTLPEREARRAIDNDDVNVTEPSSKRGYRQWNTPEAKAILRDALSGLDKYKESYNAPENVHLSEQKRQQKAINDTLGYWVSNYATASYQEGIAESFSRERKGKSNEASKAIVEHMKKLYKKAKLI